MQKRKTLKKAISISLSILFWLSLWALLSYRINSELLLPSPADTLSALTRLAGSIDFWSAAALSLLRIIIGIIIGVLIGTLVAVISARLYLADALFSPLLTVIKATPIASFIILAMLWIDKNTLPVFITVLIVLPIVQSNVFSGIRSVDISLLEVAKIYRFPLSKKIFKIYVPSVMPYFLAACRSSLGMAWKAGIAAEVLCTPTSAIGTEIYLSKTYLESSELFAWTALVIILSIIIEKLFIWGLAKLAQKFHVAKEGKTDAEA